MSNSRNQALTLVLWTCILLPARAASLRPVASTRHDQAVSAREGGATVAIAGRTIDLEMTLPNGWERKSTLHILFDRPSGLFLWEIVNTRKPTQEGGSWVVSLPNVAICVTAQRIVTFTVFGWVLRIRQSQRRATSLDEAESKALEEASHHLLDIQNLIAFDQVEINLSLWDREFRNGLPTAASLNAKLVNVVEADGKWEVTIKDQRTITLVLNDRFQVLKLNQVEYQRKEQL